ncbi:MAG: glycosyltransferase family 4 protein [Chloroflexi bacterium]|nr:glycosyltransferase family 4 protein [Chloroflexota bacterium]
MLVGIDASRAVVPEPTGTENYTRHLVRALLRLGAAHRFRLYFRSTPPETLFLADERVEHCVIPWPRLWTHTRLAWETLRRPPDVLYVLAHVLPLVHPPRCVVTVHDLGYLHYPQAHGRRQRLYLDWATRRDVHVAQRIIADSQATREDLVAHYHVHPDKIVVAYPAGADGLAPVRDPLALAAVQARYQTGERYFLYLGSLQPRKNLAMLISVFGELVEGGALGQDVRLVLAGKPAWLAEGILTQARDPRLAGRVVLPGYVPGEDLAPLLSGALAFVYPSLYEGFGLPVLEAMTCGTPVVCSSSSSLPEVAGDAALLFDPTDREALAQAMSRIQDDQVLREDLIARGLERARRFTWTACAETVLSVLEDVGGDSIG